MSDLGIRFIGVLIMLSGLWGSAYVLGMLPQGHWASPPTLMTGMISGWIGLIFVLVGKS